MDIYREATLTQAGLEEYTRVQHSQQASYAQSEGYHSYVSSVDSTTNTPFLDRYDTGRFIRQSFVYLVM